MNRRQLIGVLGILLFAGIPLVWATLSTSFSDTVWQINGAMKAVNFHLADTSIPASDHTTIGTLTTMQVGENVVYGETLYMKSDGKLWRSDADASTTMPIMAIATNTILADASGNVLLFGFLRDDSYAFTPGQIIYGSTTVGDLTATAPAGSGDQVQVLGVAISADVIYFFPSLVLVELV